MTTDFDRRGRELHAPDREIQIHGSKIEHCPNLHSSRLSYYNVLVPTVGKLGEDPPSVITSVGQSQVPGYSLKALFQVLLGVCLDLIDVFV